MHGLEDQVLGLHAPNLVEGEGDMYSMGGYNPDMRQLNLEGNPVETIEQLYEAAEKAGPVFEKILTNQRIHPGNFSLLRVHNQLENN